MNVRNYFVQHLAKCSTLYAACLAWPNLLLYLQCLGVLLATRETLELQEAPASNVSVIRTAPCPSPVTPGLDSARADLDSRGGSVLAANIGMRVMA